MKKEEPKKEEPKEEDFKIEDGIPFPTKSSKSHFDSLPLLELKYGQSILLERVADTHVKRRYASIYATIRMKLRKMGMLDKFTVGKIKLEKYPGQTDIRIWKTKK